ncbi:MAG: hypothetical protein ACP5NU_00600, partial [Methanomicrobiales archaeon]
VVVGAVVAILTSTWVGVDGIAVVMGVAAGVPAGCVVQPLSMSIPASKKRTPADKRGLCFFRGIRYHAILCYSRVY